MEQSISGMVTRAIKAGGVAGFVSVVGTIATVSLLRQSFTEFKAETASAFFDLWKKEGKQDGRLNTVERKHEELEREHNLLTREHQMPHPDYEKSIAAVRRRSQVTSSE